MFDVWNRKSKSQNFANSNHANKKIIKCANIEIAYHEIIIIIVENIDSSVS